MTKERINWIDWAKAIAVSSVVFCHLPQSQEWFYYRYLQALTMVIFFFVSGYLKRDRGSDRENWRKYTHGLLVPYLIYNAAVYPYWLAKTWLKDGGLDLLTALKPVWGALLLEHENSFCEPLNGSLWYLPAILIFHVIVDLCRKTKHEHGIMIALCLLSFVLYAANKYWYFAPNLTPMGLMRNLPYYYIGYVMGQRGLFKGADGRRDLAGFILCLTVSILFFAWHLQAFYGGQHLLHIVLFYPANIGFMFGVLYGCKLLNRVKLGFITNISIGTMVVVGLNETAISITNQIVEKVLGISGTLCYHWYEALPTALIIIALLYPIILLGKRRFPILLGR